MQRRRITQSLITDMRGDQRINTIIVRFGLQRLEPRMHQNHRGIGIGNGFFDDAIAAGAVGIGLAESQRADIGILDADASCRASLHA